jgi:hypothetical protein
MLETQDRPYLCKWDKTRYKRALLLGGPSEDEIQTGIVEALNISRVDVEIVDSGSNKLRLAFSRVLHSVGLSPELVSRILGLIRNVAPSSEPGRTDLSGVLAPNGRGFFIEVKAPAKLDPTTGNVLRSAGKPKPEQLAYMDKKHAQGAIVGVAWSIDDAFEIIGSSNLLAHQQALRNGTKYF